MEYVFLFHGGPLDGSAFRFDPDEFKTGDEEFGGKAWLDTAKGKIGRQFTVENPFVPSDEHGSVWEFKKHRYEVTSCNTRDGKVTVDSKHICPMRDTCSGPNEKI